MMIRQPDESGQEAGHHDQGVDVHRRPTRITGPGRGNVGALEPAGERLVIATGSGFRVPDIEGLAAAYLKGFEQL